MNTFVAHHLRSQVKRAETMTRRLGLSLRNAQQLRDYRQAMLDAYEDDGVWPIDFMAEHPEPR